MVLGKVFSLQSHVVSGYVGNKCASLVLQVLGFEVDSLNTVNFSNHTYYKTIAGSVTTGKDFEEIHHALLKNNLNSHTHILSGYVRTIDFLEYLKIYVEESKAQNPEIKFFCDPVLGDNGKLYCPSEFVSYYKEHLLKIADVITPNQFEAELISGLTIGRMDELHICLQSLHSKGPSTVIITGCQLEEYGEDTLICVVSSKKDKVKNEQFEFFMIPFPRINNRFVGTGDVFTALLLSHIEIHENLIDAIICSLTCIQGILRRTVEKIGSTAISTDQNTEPLELNLVDCIDLILKKEIRQDKYKPIYMGLFDI